MNRAVFLILAALLAGCEVHSKRADDNVTINASDSGQVDFNLPFVKGSVKLPEGAMRNGEFDIDGVKMYPGGKITGVSVFAKDKGATVTMAFNAPAAPDQVRAYFVDQFKKKGAKASLVGDSISGTTRDGDPFVIQVGTAAQGSQGKIEIQDKD
jgi:hypothetical protein